MNVKYLAILILCLGAFTCTAVTNAKELGSSNCQETPAAQSQDVAEFLNRWKDVKRRNLVENATWTLIHDYTDAKHVDEVLKVMQTYFAALEKYEKGDHADLDQLGGLKTFKDKMAGWLDMDDQAVRGFGAIMLGISGDRAFTPQLVKLLNRKESASELITYDRGDAAVALGLVGAKEHTSELVKLLKSSNENDRAGAAYGLGWLGANEQANAIAELLNDEKENVREFAKASLELMGRADLIQRVEQRRPNEHKQ